MGRTTTRSIPAIAGAILIGVLSLGLAADEVARRAEVEAATAQAFDRLRLNVMAVPLTNDITVERMIDRYDAGEQFDAFLHTARDVGGTRWVDEQTAQVRLEISGDEIAKFLEGLAQRDPKKLPLPLKTLRERYKRDFMHRTFAGVGTSTAGAVADRLRPDPSQVSWRGVSEKERVAAINTARHAALERVIDSLQPIEWGGAHRLGDAISRPAARDALAAWLLSRPITSIEFHDDLTVQISLAAAPGDVLPEIHALLEQHTPGMAPQTPAEWERLRIEVQRRMAPATGVALAQSGAIQPDASVAAMPVTPPAWARDVMEAEGVSPRVGGSKLHTARAAEARAMERLREKISALPLTPTTTLGDAARKDSRIAASLRRSEADARIRKVEYDAPTPGSVRVCVTLDLQELWKELGAR